MDESSGVGDVSGVVEEESSGAGDDSGSMELLSSEDCAKQRQVNNININKVVNTIFIFFLVVWNV